MPVIDAVAKEFNTTNQSVIQLVFETIGAYLISGGKKIICQANEDEEEIVKMLNANSAYKIYFAAMKSNTCHHIFNIHRSAC